MKIKNLLLTSGIVILSSVGIVLVVRNPKPNARKDYEKFLVSEYKGLSHGEFTTEKISGKEVVDRPDEAAFAEYIKTLDPALKAVPGERIIAANKTADALRSLK